MKTQIIILITVLLIDVASALGVVYAKHQSRRLAVELGNLESLRDESIGEWSRLQLEQAYLADAGHIELKAQQELQMHTPEETRILVVRQ